ncbi:hypothetical protein BIFBIF_01737 [Bifidobacterium bifidum ATCC 29521 = JCM 1255 = DSM 20456]|nr:hypothetical protein BIFBIF_01737 [Bifidobacterium bifidum ATCC 29521 = JCM 1255 = DSM 20456]
MLTSATFINILYISCVSEIRLMVCDVAKSEQKISFRGISAAKQG